jgi:hypothetical protein
VIRPLGWPPITVVDVSLRGVRLSIPVGEAERPLPESLGRIVSQLREVLLMQLFVEFRPDDRGALVKRRLVVVRIGPRNPKTGHLELGCVIEPPLTRVEATALELPLPEEGETPEEARLRFLREREGGPPEDPMSSVARTWPGQRCRAYLQGGYASKMAPVLAETERLTPTRVVLRVPDRAHLNLPPSAQDALSLVLAFDTAYGPEVQLKIVDGGEDLWKGPVRLEDVATVPGPKGQILLGFSFAHRLQHRELKALRLA